MAKSLKFQMPSSAMEAMMECGTKLMVGVRLRVVFCLYQEAAVVVKVHYKKLWNGS